MLAASRRVAGREDHVNCVTFADLMLAASRRVARREDHSDCVTFATLTLGMSGRVAVPLCWCAGNACIKRTLSLAVHVLL